jgi:hypothetical protein
MNGSNQNMLEIRMMFVRSNKRGLSLQLDDADRKDPKESLGFKSNRRIG